MGEQTAAAKQVDKGVAVGEFRLQDSFEFLVPSAFLPHEWQWGLGVGFLFFFHFVGCLSFFVSLRSPTLYKTRCQNTEEAYGLCRGVLAPLSLSGVGARLWRQGQESGTVVVQHIITADSIDERIMKALHAKGNTQARLIDAVKAEVSAYGRK